MDAARQPAGIPVGGQFAATTHAEPDVSLEAPAPSHSPTRHHVLIDQANKRYSLAHKMLREQDQLSMEVVSSMIMRDYPSATELRIKQNISRDGKWLGRDLASVRDKDGLEITPEDSSWTGKAEPNHGRSMAATFRDIRGQFFDADNDFAYDSATNEIVVPLGPDYAEGIDLIV